MGCGNSQPEDQDPPPPIILSPERPKAKEVYRKLFLKAIVLGDSGVGKSSLMNRFVSSQYTDQYKATIGADFMTKELNLNGKVTTLQIWDTAGQERFQSVLGVGYYRGADCCALVFDLTSEESFNSITSWKEEFWFKAQPLHPKFPFVLLGNKTDLEDERQVSPKKIQKWCQDNGGIPYFEVSAKSGVWVDKAFTSLATSAADYLEEKNESR